MSTEENQDIIILDVPVKDVLNILIQPSEWWYLMLINLLILINTFFFSNPILSDKIVSNKIAYVCLK